MRSRQLWCVFVIFLLAYPVHSAKVVRLYNAWPDSNMAFQMIGGWDGKTWNSINVLGNEVTLKGEWFEKVLPATWTPSSKQNTIRYASDRWFHRYGARGINSAIDIDIASVLKTSDTVWIVPTPAPDGPAVLTGKRPKQFTVMLWNPWRANMVNRIPSMRVGNQGWARMRAVTSLSGWYTTTVMNFDSLDVLFRNKDSSEYLGAKGLGKGTESIRLDSMSLRNDTVWVRAVGSEPVAPLVSEALPKTKRILFYNPWDGSIPVARPLVSLDGSAYFDVPFSQAICGWYEVDVLNPNTKIVIKKGGKQEYYGQEGIGSKLAIEVGKILQQYDTAWIAPTYASEKRPPYLGALYSGERGVCQNILLASTVRDFGDDNPSFEKTASCRTNGMVRSQLGSDRKPIPTLRADRCNVGDSARMATQFFQDVPGVNAATCRDISLTLDTVTGMSSYTNVKKYFPINDFDTLENGKPNPFNSKSKYGNNFHFCLESHGDFPYRKGEVFKFLGDDDVFFFVNKKLVVDLGGVHGQRRAEVLLDTMKLVEGKTYDWDFFYCERHTGSSSMSINTTMNLRTPAEFMIRDSAWGKGIIAYNIYLDQLIGQGCNAKRTRIPTSGLFRISGPAFDKPTIIKPGLNFGGIVVDSNLGRMMVDTANISGLPPGRYEVKVMPLGDTAKIKSTNFAFTVPLPKAVVRFVSTPVYRGFTETVLPVTVGAFRKENADTSRLLFRIPAVPGLQIYKDSARAQPLADGDTLWTGVAGKVRSLWVQGKAVGDYTLQLWDADDSIQDRYTNISFYDRGLRFTDSTGKPYSTLPSVRANVGDTVTVYLEAYVRDSTCTRCSDTVLLKASTDSLGFLDPVTNRPAQQVVLVQGKAVLKLTAGAVVRNASVLLQTKDSLGGKADASLSPISFEPYTVVYTDASGKPLPSDWKLDTTIQTPVKLGVQLEGVKGVCTTCVGSLHLQVGTSYHVVNDSGSRVDSWVIRDGKASFALVGDRATSLDSLRTQGSSLYAPSTLGNLRFYAFPPDSAAWYDDDGNGEADRAVVHLHHRWTDSTQLFLSWPDTGKWLGVESGKMIVSPDSMTVTFVPTRQIPGTTASDSMLGRWTLNGNAPQPFVVQDRIAAVPTKATMHWGTTHDTLRIRTSEPLRPVSKNGLLVEIGEGAIFTPSSQQNAWYDVATGELVLVYPANDAANIPRVGDSVRLGSEAADLLGNVPGDTRKVVTVTGVDLLPRDAVLLDSDADGRADRVVLRLLRPIHATTGYSFRWPNRDGNLEQRQVNVRDGKLDSLGLRLTFDLPEPFAFGATQCPVVGCQNLGESFTHEGSAGKFVVRDGVDPFILKAHLTYADSTQNPDTLQLMYSEPVSTVQESKIWASWGVPSVNPVGKPIPSLDAALDGSSMSVKLPIVINASFPFQVGDSVRITRKQDGNTRDLAENAPESLAVWTVVTEGIRPLQLKVDVVPPVQKLSHASSSSAEPMEIFVYNPQSGRWINLQGQPVDTTGYIGIRLVYTGALRGFAYFYDNMGVSVISKDIGILAQLAEQKRIPLDLKGQSRVLVAWNGKRPDGQTVPPGIYVSRVVGKLENSKRQAFFNYVLKLGWRR